jgi:hypothetical protein
MIIVHCIELLKEQIVPKERLLINKEKLVVTLLLKNIEINNSIISLNINYFSFLLYSHLLLNKPPYD